MPEHDDRTDPKDNPEFRAIIEQALEKYDKGELPTLPLAAEALEEIRERIRRGVGRTRPPEPTVLETTEPFEGRRAWLVLVEDESTRAAWERGVVLGRVIGGFVEVQHTRAERLRGSGEAGPEDRWAQRIGPPEWIPAGRISRFFLVDDEDRRIERRTGCE